MFSPLLTQVLFWMCLVIFLRLFTYQRGDARFKRGMSCLAWIVMGSAGATMLNILKGELVIPEPAWPLVIMVGVFVWAVMRAGGNMAGVLRPEPALSWPKVERRRASHESKN
jgi:hypothetical protein